MKSINKHTSLLYAKELHEICKPLHRLDISYFAHVRIENNTFAGINNNPNFTKHYLENHYFNADIHMAESNKLGKFIIWDNIERFGLSEKMHIEAGQFGVKHTFTIIKQSADRKDFYHFANNHAGKQINQVYLSNLDLLQHYIAYFDEQIKQSNHLAEVYKQVFKLDQSAPGYQITPRQPLFSEEIKNKFLLDIHYSINKKYDNVILSQRERECIFLTVRGKTAKQIGQLLGISYRTVEEYLGNIKQKFNVKNKNELIEIALDYFTITHTYK